MTEADLKVVIQTAGGEWPSLDYAGQLLEKINRLEGADAYRPLLSQLGAAKNPGDFRGHVLEVNFADYFVKRSIELGYGAKQGMSGDIDFCWCVNDDKVFIEIKLLGQDIKTKEATAQQLTESGVFAADLSDDTVDIARLQRDIFQKSSTKKFNPNPQKNWVNLVAVDVSELQRGAVDRADCLLAAIGNAGLVRRHCHPLTQRPAVVGVFEPTSQTRTTDQAYWVQSYHPKFVANIPHPRSYIHGVLFLFRKPRERAALSYQLKCGMVWNPSLVDEARSNSIIKALHQVIPPAWR